MAKVAKAGNKQYFVEGGGYESTRFERLATPLVKEGPFSSYEEAYSRWEALSWDNVDDCLMRFEITSK